MLLPRDITVYHIDLFIHRSLRCEGWAQGKNLFICQIIRVTLTVNSIPSTLALELILVMYLAKSNSDAMGHYIPFHFCTSNGNGPPQTF